MMNATARGLPTVALWLTLNLSVASTANGQTPRTADAEAKQVAAKVWAKVFTKCGDSYFYVGSELDREKAKVNNGGPQLVERVVELDAFVEYKSISFHVSSEPVSTVERLNGLEWKGQMGMVPEAMRRGGESLWVSGFVTGRCCSPAYFWVVPRLYARKVNGRWLLSHEDTFWMPLSPDDVTDRTISCASVKDVETRYVEREKQKALEEQGGWFAPTVPPKIVPSKK